MTALYVTVTALYVTAFVALILCMLYLAAWLDAPYQLPTEADEALNRTTVPYEFSEADDRAARERIEDQREADFYREDPDEFPIDEEDEDA